MEKIAVVILNWNGRHLLEKFIPSVIANSPGATIYVVDNASADDSITFLKATYPEVNLIIHEQNLGFATGYNKALQEIDATYCVILNSDVEVTPGWLAPLTALMDAHTDIAACQPKILAEGRKDTFEYAGAGGGFIDKYGFPFCRGRLFDSLEADAGQYDDTREVFWASGACMFVRKKAFLEAGGFDDDFFAHMEEIDLCWRMKHLGYRVMYCGSSTVYHVGGATLNKASARKTYLNFRNNLCMLYKNTEAHRLSSTLFIKKVLDGIAGIKFFMAGHWPSAFAVFRAHMYFYGNKAALKRKRKEIRQVKASCIYGRSIVVKYFLKGKKKFSELDSKSFN